MADFKWQRWVFKKARVHGWDGIEPSILGTPQADAAFEQAKKFLTGKVSYSMANIWFSGTCPKCQTWSGVWKEHSTTEMECPDCGALQNVKFLELNEERKKPIKLDELA